MSNDVLILSILCIIVYSILVFSLISMLLLSLCEKPLIIERFISLALGITSIVLFLLTSFFKHDGLADIFYYLRIFLFFIYFAFTSITLFYLVKKIRDLPISRFLGK